MDEYIDPRLVPRNAPDRTERTIERILEYKTALIERVSENPYDEHGKPIRALLCETIKTLPTHLRETYSYDILSEEITHEREKADKTKIKNIEDVCNVLNMINASKVSSDELLVALCKDYSVTITDIEETVSTMLEDEVFDFSNMIHDKPTEGGEYPPNEMEYSVANQLIQDFTTFLRDNKEKEQLRINFSNNNLCATDPVFMYRNHGSPMMLNMFKLLCHLLETMDCKNVVYLDLRNNKLAYQYTIILLSAVRRTCPQIVIDLRGNEEKHNKYKCFKWIITDW